VDREEGKRDDAEGLEAAHGPVEGLGIVELKEQKGNWKKEEQALQEISLFSKRVGPKDEEDEQGG